MLTITPTQKIKFIVPDKRRALQIIESLSEKTLILLNERYNPRGISSGNNFVADANITLDLACQNVIESMNIYPTDLETLLNEITCTFQKLINELVRDKLLPQSRLTMLTSSGSKTLRKAIKHLFWYPLGVSKFNPDLWCKHWTLKRECRTCKFMTLLLLKNIGGIAFPPKDILKTIFAMLPDKHTENLRNPPALHTCLIL